GGDLQVFDKGVHVRPNGAGRSEVREEQRVWIPGFDVSRTLDPELDVDIRRWRRRPDVVAGHSDARDVAYQRHTAESIEEADVMIGMSRRVADVQRAPGDLDTNCQGRRSERHNVRRWHRRNLTP